MQTKLAAVQERGEIATVDSILEAVGADRWSDAAIMEHQEAERAKAPPPSRWLAFRPILTNLYMEYDEIGIPIWACLVGLVAGVLTWSLDAAWWGVGISAVVAAFVGGLLYEPILESLMHIRIRGHAKWVMVSPNKEKMPARAHQLVADIKSMSPGCKFALEKLVQDKEDLDPVLFATFEVSPGKRETRAILVWDGEGNIIAPPA